MDRYISKLETIENNYNKRKVKKHNKKFINEELINSKSLLDDINGYSLDYNQRLSVIINEDNNLVIAGAGSGKTLTIVGKVRYLIERLKIDKSEILCISFTNDSVNSLKKALLKNYNYDIDVFTFHKLALNIIKNNNDNIKIARSDTLDYVIDEFFYSNMHGLDILKSENKDNYISLKILITTFINLFKSSNYSTNKFDIFPRKAKKKEEYILLEIIKHIYIEYQSELKSKCEVDFNDMINDAVYILENNGNMKNYKYIIIDEYQDTSYTKYRLIKVIKDRTKAKLYAVGDDFQSIYRFTGCDLDIFLKFNKYYGQSKIIKIENTYRNSKELIRVAGSFIMRNKKQIRKKLNSNKNIYKPIKIIYYEDIRKAFLKIISMIDTPILVLGRNNKDIYKILDDDLEILNNGIIIYKKNIGIKMRYMTVHKSKGLEEENVIIINLDDGTLGFPSKIKNNSILRFVLNDKDVYPYEEERRLFYVALTRTKNNVYLLVDKNNISIFVKELIKIHRFNIQIINELI